jgi:DNA-binding SARP family transcriptional activator
MCRPSRTCDKRCAAAELCRGPLVDDVAVSDEGGNEWLTSERKRLLELALHAIGLGEQELVAARAGARPLKAGQRAISLNNLREDAHRLIIRALAASGRKAEALRALSSPGCAAQSRAQVMLPPIFIQSELESGG